MISNVRTLLYLYIYIYIDYVLVLVYLFIIKQTIIKCNFCESKFQNNTKALNDHS